MSSDKNAGAGRNGFARKLDDAAEKRKTRTPEERKLHRRKILYAIASLAISCLIWSMVMARIDPEITHVYPGVKVELVNEEVLLEKSLAVRLSEPQYVSVKVSGRRSMILKNNSSRIQASADVSGLKKGRGTVRVDISTPNYLECDSVNPSGITVVVEPILSEERPVEVSFKETGEERSQPVVLEQESETVSVTGTKSMVSDVAKVAAVIDAGKVSDSESEVKVDLVPVDKKGNRVDGVRVTRKSMQVRIRNYIKKDVTLITSVTGEPEEGYKLLGITAPETIRIILPSERFSEVESVTAEPVDVTGLKKGRRVNLMLDLPEDCRLAEGESDPSMRIAVAEITSRTFKISTDEIEIDNLPEGMTLTFPSDSVEICLKGVVTELSKIKKSDVFVSVNASDAHPSETALPLSVTVRQNGLVQDAIEAEASEVQVVIE